MSIKCELQTLGQDMFEESAVSRNSQKLAAVGLFIFGIPLVAFSIFAIGKLALLGFPNKVAPVVFLIIALIGASVNVLGYRLFSGKGVKKGGGVMTPAAYFMLGSFFVLLSLIASYIFYLELNYILLFGILCSLIRNYSA